MTDNPTTPEAQGQVERCGTCRSNRRNVCWIEHGGALARLHPHKPGTCCFNPFHTTPAEAQPVEQGEQRESWPLYVCRGCGGYGQDNKTIHHKTRRDPCKSWSVERIYVRRESALTTAQQTIEELTRERDEAQREREYQTDRANTHGTTLLWLWQALALDDQDEGESLLDYLNRWPRDKVAAAILARATELVETAEEAQSLITQTVKWCEELADAEAAHPFKKRTASAIRSHARAAALRSCAAKLKGET